MERLLAVCVVSLWVACSSTRHAVVDVTGPFAQPESVVHDPAADVYLVSSIGGAPLARDGNGYITRLSSDGKVLARAWISGGQRGATLDAPKGLAIAGDVLFVADIDHVRTFALRDGTARGNVPVAGAKFLNDVLALDARTVLVSDTATNRIHRVTAEGTVELFAEDPGFGGANGLARQGSVLFVVGYDDGTVSRLDLAGKLLSRSRPGPGQLDGVSASPARGVVFASWADKAVVALDSQGKHHTLFSGLESPADIALDEKRGRLLVPLMAPGRLLAFPLEKGAKP